MTGDVTRHVCLQQVTRDMTGDVTRHVTSRISRIGTYMRDLVPC